MSVTIVQLLDWAVGQIDNLFWILDQYSIAPGVSVIAFSVASALTAYFVGVLILRA